MSTIRRWLPLLTAFLLGAPAQAQTASPFRYDDDATIYADQAGPYAKLKYVPFGDGSFASFGADLRERVEAADVGVLGLRSPRADAYDLHRLLVDADLHVGPSVRFFAQLGSDDEVGRRAGPTPLDRDRLDLAQGFVDVGQDVAGGHLVGRIGRAEMSFDDGALIGLRDGPNVRQSWDGARLTWRAGSVQLDGFAVRPVAVRAGVFDDASHRAEAIEGVHLTAPFGPAVAVDAFFYHNINPRVAILGVAGRERTDTTGARLRLKWRRLDGSGGVIVQGGNAAGRPVQAFALHGDVGMAFGNTGDAPRLGLRADVLSGGNPNGRRIGTFNALYPNVAYSTEATIEAPANLVQVGAVGSTSVGHAISLQYTLEGLWRYTSRDAFYAAPLAPLVRPGGDADRFSGVEQQVRAVWRPDPILTVTMAVVRFAAGDPIRRAGGRDETFAMASVALRL